MPSHRGTLALSACLAFALLLPARGQPPAVESGKSLPKEQALADRDGKLLPPGALARFGSARFRGTSSLLASAFAPDGKSVFALHSDGTVRRWDLGGRLAVGRELVPGDKNDLAQPVALPMRALAVGRSADRRPLVAVAEEDHFRILDGDTGKVLQEIVAKGFSIRQLALAPDGRTLTAVGREAVVKFWDIASGKEVRALPHLFAARQGAFSPDGKLIATPDFQEIRIWDMATGKELHRLKGTLQRWELAFSADSKLLLGLLDDGRIHVWDAGSGAEKPRLPRLFASASPRAFALSPDGKTLAAGSEDGTLSLWHLEAGKEICRHEGVRTEGGLIFAEDSKTLISVTGLGFRVWDAATGAERFPVREHWGPVTAVAFAPDGALLATGAEDGSVILWEATAQARRLLGGHDGAVTWLAFSANGQILGSASRKRGPASQNDVRIWNMKDGKCISKIPLQAVVTHTGFPMLALSPDGKALALVDRFAVWLYDTPTGWGRPVFALLGGGVVGVAYARDGSVLVALAEEGTVAVWDIATAKERPRIKLENGPFPLPHRSHSLLLSADGRWLTYPVPEGDGLGVWEIASGKECLRGKGPRHPPALFVGSLDEGFLAAGAADGTILVWDALSGKEYGRVPSAAGSVSALAISPDSRTLVVGQQDSTALLWPLKAPPKRPVAPRKLSAEEFAGLWRDLEGKDAGKALQAVWGLSRAGESALPLLREKLRSLVKPPQVERLVADLDNRRFQVREAAERELERLGDLAVAALRRELSGKPTEEVRRRAERLLERLTAPNSPARVWAARIAAVLERIGTTEARALLEELIRVAPGSGQADEAQASLRRVREQRK